MDEGESFLCDKLNYLFWRFSQIIDIFAFELSGLDIGKLPFLLFCHLYTDVAVVGYRNGRNVDLELGVDNGANFWIESPQTTGPIVFATFADRPFPVEVEGTTDEDYLPLIPFLNEIAEPRVVAHEISNLVKHIDIKLSCVGLLPFPNLSLPSWQALSSFWMDLNHSPSWQALSSFLMDLNRCYCPPFLLSELKIAESKFYWLTSWMMGSGCG